LIRLRQLIKKGCHLRRNTKRGRSVQRQLGQYLTPEKLASEVANEPLLRAPNTTLEPSFGEGAFLLPVIAHYMELEQGSTASRLEHVLNERVWGVEIDPVMYDRAIAAIEARWGSMPARHNLVCGDYFLFEPGSIKFDLIIGNPPFGGTFDAALEDQLDRRYGRYGGRKLKKETYSFFTAKALEELAPDGELAFICSDTFLTISTMGGLRMLLMDSGMPTVSRLHEFSDETKYDMVWLRLESGPAAEYADVLGNRVARPAMEATGNHSWTIGNEHAHLFSGTKVGDVVVATGGMTIGRNELFVREIRDGQIEETFDFGFEERPITLDDERAQARLGKVAKRRELEVTAQEAEGKTRRVVTVTPRDHAVAVDLPSDDYRYYNKASGERLYSEPRHAVFWKDEGDAVLTFKRTGPWYLRGVGGGPFFGREGLTWQLVSQRINARYLPAGYILDSGAPCGFLRPGVDTDELWVILAWLQTELATTILKQVINHTRNIQGKDIERLPYPWWVAASARADAANRTRLAVGAIMAGEQVDREALAREVEALMSPDTVSLASAA
jgi:N-6 DNA Methylase